MSDTQILTIDATDWNLRETDSSWIAALEAGNVLYFPRLAFQLKDDVRRFLHPDINAEGSLGITLEADGRFNGADGDAATQAAVAAMVGRFRANARQWVESLLPHYRHAMRMATTSYRPKQVEARTQT